MVPKSMFCKEFLRLPIQYKSDLTGLQSTTMKKSCVLFLLGFTFLVLIGVQGTPIMRNGRCSCISSTQGKIHLQSLKDLKQFSPSPSCGKTEIIATKKDGTQICLNPDSTKVKELVEKWKKQISQKKKQKKGKKQRKVKKSLKKSQRPHQKKTA
ncbi:C-X-C motif chemokine 9 [Oryctolagus cuniculus]|uniref:C-X-C motif chemokine 9 n=1 Tax=Oryctolagus cuniculus TaxID=9986 RepID=UPI002231BF60|nr:C-X-C motif chemokine 9 [Oryctolagus cuniculus]